VVGAADERDLPDAAEEEGGIVERAVRSEMQIDGVFDAGRPGLGLYDVVGGVEDQTADRQIGLVPVEIVPLEFRRQVAGFRMVASDDRVPGVALVSIGVDGIDVAR